MKAKWFGWAAAGVALVVLFVTLGFVIYNWPVQGIPPGWSVLNGDAQWNWANGRINAHTVNGDSILASSDEYGNVTFSTVVGTTTGRRPWRSVCRMRTTVISSCSLPPAGPLPEGRPPALSPSSNGWPGMKPPLPPAESGR
jgi:hypothetical protein